MVRCTARKPTLALRTVGFALLLLCVVAPAARADWSSPVTLADSSAIRYTTRAAANPSGDAVVVWTHWYDPYTTSLEGTWRTRDGAWSPEVTLSGEVWGLAGGGNNVTIAPAVGINDSGKAAVAWTKENSGSGHDLYVSIKPPGADFGDPVMLSGLEPKTVYYPGVGVDEGGDVLAFWVNEDDYSIHAAEARAGSSFGPAQTIVPSSSFLSSVSYAVSADGDSVITWADRHHTYVRVREADGSLDPIQVLTRPDETCWAEPATVGIDSSGDALAAWPARVGDCTLTTIRYAWRAAGESGFGPTHDLLTENQDPTLGAAVSRDGRATLAFSWTDGDNSPLAAAEADPLGTFGDPTAIGPQTGADPLVAYDDSDDVFVGWWDWNDAVFDNLAHVVTRGSGAAWSAPSALSSVGSADLSLAGMRSGVLASYVLAGQGIVASVGTPASVTAKPQPVAPSLPESHPIAASTGASPVPAVVTSTSTPRQVTVHVRARVTGVLAARLVKGHRRYGTRTVRAKRNRLTAIVFSGRDIPPGRYTVLLALRVRHVLVNSWQRAVTLP